MDDPNVTAMLNFLATKADDHVLDQALMEIERRRAAICSQASAATSQGTTVRLLLPDTGPRSQALDGLSGTVTSLPTPGPGERPHANVLLDQKSVRRLRERTSMGVSARIDSATGRLEVVGLPLKHLRPVGFIPEPSA